MTPELFVQAISTYAPENETDTPSLSYLPALFRRRLSQMTKMTVESVHGLLEAVPDLDKAHVKLVFGSFRGELSYAFKVNNQFAEDGTVMPASFTLSVHNAAVAEATIAFGLTGGYTTVFPEQGDFFSALQAAAAAVLSGDEKQVIFVFGDERIPAPYADVAIAGTRGIRKAPFVFAALLSAEQGQRLDIGDFCGKSARDFMQQFSVSRQ